MTIALSTAGYWHFAGIEESLRHLADGGVSAVELFCYPPHIDTVSFGRYERVRIRRLMENLGIRCTSAAVSAELNLLSLHTGLHELAMRELRLAMEIAADLEAPCLVLAVGRRHGILPAPMDATVEFMCREIASLADHAQRVGVKLAIETLPSDMLTTGKAVMEVIERIDHPALGVCYDCSNTLAQEDPALGVREVADKLLLVHVSDCWRAKWAHTAIGRGEVDFAAFASALGAIGYAGDVVYELMDGEDPRPRLADGLQRLRAAGFA